MGRGGRKSQSSVAGQRSVAAAKSDLVEKAKQFLLDKGTDDSRMVDPADAQDYRAKTIEVLQDKDRPAAVCIVHSDELIDNEMAQSMAERIDLYHIATGDVMNKRAFEYGFVNAAQQSGHNAQEVDSRTNPGTDVFFDSWDLSLKTESRQRINDDRMVVSKLMQSTDIRNKIKSPQDAVDFVPEILDHLARYNKIIMLRAFRDEIDETNEEVRYEMLEIPKRMLIRGLKSLEKEDFSEPTSTGSTTAKVRNSQGDVIFTLALDGSAGKVTLREVSTKKCKPHATWISQKNRDL